mmetsp:Transcript_26635/g.56282  ORF Transcript_26635/g.56282 Transcript_26635/m.56282 type:complete len:172 (+) Transcript_26635:212-727(+)|eukprot:CAMPEP_0183731736 /NCGR_PEP_ID=MMETSP0737-20130205/36315_1 /TAXON_ID=385413 /ORGANISM="Thalassiosira miniscula, Strain CCMP1093" /LENGTH=171 /DNA_ID=CAMNT_0025964551 /DNA_START=85 /DNA_END=600 /DNA_ORIENTATION=-
MKGISKIANVSLFGLSLSLLAIAARASNSVNDEQHTFQLARTLQTEARASESEALDNCIGDGAAALTCGLCVMTVFGVDDVLTDAFNDVLLNNGTDTDEIGTESVDICSSVDCEAPCVAEACPENCHDEFYVALDSTLKDFECDACSPGFKTVAKATIASLAGVFMGWMII